MTAFHQMLQSIRWG